MIFFRVFFLALTLHCFASDWQSQREFFEANGYLWLKKFFSAEQVAVLTDLTEEIHRDSEKILKLMQQSDDPTQITKIPGTLIVVPEAKNPNLACRAEDMLTCYPDLYHLIAGTITSYIGHVMDEPYVLFKDKINFKWPGGGAFSPHQDFPAYEPFGPKEHITAMVCIDAATLENGCLQVAKDWKKTFANELENNLVLPFVVGGKNHGSIEPALCERIEWIPLEAEPGDVLIFNSYVPHYSEPNKSARARRAMFLTHNRMKDGDLRRAYYHAKRTDPNNPLFHIGTPTKARTKD